MSVCINNKYLNQASDSWLRIPGEVSDLIYILPSQISTAQLKYSVNISTILTIIVTQNSSEPGHHVLLNHPHGLSISWCHRCPDVTIFPRPHYLLISEVLYRYRLPYIVSSLSPHLAATQPQIAEKKRREFENCQAQVRSPKVQSPKVKTKGTWADTRITWATTTPPPPHHPLTFKHEGAPW